MTVETNNLLSNTPFTILEGGYRDSVGHSGVTCDVSTDSDVTLEVDDVGSVVHVTSTNFDLNCVGVGALT